MSPGITNIRIAAIALLMALLVLGVAVQPAKSDTTSGSGGAFGLDSTTAIPSKETTEDSKPVTTAVAEPETTVATTTPTTTSTTTATPATPQQPEVTNQVTDPNLNQYQEGPLADTGGVPPSNPLIPGLILGAGGLGIALVNRRWLASLINHTNNRKDDDVFFG